MKNKWLGLLSIIILCFVQFSYKAQKCNTLFINNVDILQMKFLKVDCKPNKNNINSIKYIGETIDSIKFSILRKDRIIANFLCNPVGVNIEVNNNNRYVNDLEELLMISHTGNYLGITVFKNKKENYFYIPLILNDNCY
ncbi:hypothetical protein ACE193_19255 [Bernardetia sp. OM2101]|uniref:hypothetical protein n=1 Tax=Bernardetia sp. OM2101 TaxID=3344876 RepID=UPI0035CF419B